LVTFFDKNRTEQKMMIPICDSKRIYQVRI
jgi:hypothetical protein